MIIVLPVFTLSGIFWMHFIVNHRLYIKEVFTCELTWNQWISRVRPEEHRSVHSEFLYIAQLIQSSYICLDSILQRTWEAKAIYAEMTSVSSHDVQKDFLGNIRDASKALARAEWIWWLHFLESLIPCCSIIHNKHTHTHTSRKSFD